MFANTNDEAMFSGAFPAFGGLNDIVYDLPLNANIPHLYYNQRYKPEVFSVGTNQIVVDQTTGEFTLEFGIRDHTLNGMHAFAAPVNFYTYTSFNDFLTAAGLTGSNADLFNENVQLFKRNIDVDNLYFYLESIPFSPQLSLYDDITITAINKSSTPGISVLNSSDIFVNPVPAGDNLTNDPNLFHIGKVRMASFNDGLPYNENAYSQITVTGTFNCARPDIQTWINDQNITSSALPFNVVVNYNCNADFQGWTEDNAPYYELETANNNGVDELTFTEAEAHRCNNDALDSFDLIVSKVYYTMDVEDVSTDPCQPLFKVTVYNQNTGSIMLGNINIVSAVSGYSITGLSACTEVQGLSNDSFFIEFPAGCYTPFDIEVEVTATSYCVNCVNNTNGSLSVAGMGTFNYGMGTPTNPLIDFSNYTAFSGTLCLNIISSTEVEVLLNDPLALSTSTSVMDYDFNFTLSDGTNTCNLNYTWTSNTTLNSVIFDLSACNINVCNGLSIRLNNVSTTITCSGELCEIVVQTMEEECSISGLGLDNVVITHFCDGGDDGNGAISMDIVGGTAPCINNISWTGVSGATTTNITSLMPGDYTITVEDCNGCEVSETFIVENLYPQGGCFDIHEENCTYNFDNLFTDFVFTNSNGTSTAQWTIIDLTTSTTVYTSNDWNLIGYSFLTGNDYEVMLTVTNELDGQSCSADCSQIISPCTVDCIEDVDAAFSVEHLSNGDFEFVNTSTSNGGVLVGSVQWDWGDGSANSYSAGQNVFNHSYSASGIYTVCMTVTYSFGDDGICTETVCEKVAYCVDKPDPTCGYVNISGIQNAGSSTVAFTALLTPVGSTFVSGEWFFGDGSPSVTTSSSNVSHTYPSIPVGSGPSFDEYDVTVFVSMINPNGEKCTVCITERVRVTRTEPDKTEGEVLIIPNPTDGTFNVKLLNVKTNKELQVRIRNSVGKVVFQDAGIYRESLEFNLTKLPPGIYSLELFNEDISLFEQFIIIR